MKKKFSFVIAIILVFGLSSCKEYEFEEGTLDKGPSVAMEDLSLADITDVNFDYVKKDANEIAEVDFICFAEHVFTFASENKAQGILTPDNQQYPGPTSIMNIYYDHPDYESISIHVYSMSSSLFYKTPYQVTIHYQTESESIGLIYYQSFDDEISKIIK